MLPSTNRKHLRRASALVTALALGVAGPRFAGASGAPPDAASHETSAQRARVVLVADVGADSELAALIHELLERQHVHAEIERAPRFDPDALFAEQTRGTLGVFIALRTPREARLYFRAPGGERYLVRKLSLPSGLDAVGRELLGQVVASSAEALLGEAEALSREQASAEIANETPPAVAPLHSAAAPPRPAVEQPPPSKADASRAAWDPRLLARYSLLGLGPDFGVRHGPGLGLGARFGRTVLFGTELGGELHFEQTFTAPEATGHLRSRELHALLECGLRLSAASSATLAAGPRLELSDFHLESDDPSVTPRAPSRRTRPGLRVEARYEWTAHHLILGFAATLDLAFARTHYDLSLPNGSTEQLASVWPVRPGATLSVGVH